MDGLPAKVDKPALPGIFESLRNLEARLLRMVEEARAQSGRDPGADQFMGLYVSEADVLRYLKPAEAAAAPGGTAVPLATGKSFAALGATYGLSRLELDALLIALAPEIDARYERIFAYLQDDVSRRRPSIDLILSLLGESAADKLEKRAMFAASSALAANRLIRLHGDPQRAMSRREVCVDPRIASFLMEESGLDAALARFVRVIEPAGLGRPADAGLVRAARRAAAGKQPLRIYFRGADDFEKRSAAVALGAEVGAALLVADVGLAARGGELEERLLDLAREALLRGAIVYLEHLDAIVEEAARESVLRTLPVFPGLVIISGIGELRIDRVPVRGMITVAFEIPDWPARRNAWSRALSERGVAPAAVVLDALAECFRFSAGQIDEAVETAANLAEYRGESVAAEHLFEAARARCGHELATLTRKINPAHGWDDIILPDDAREQLREICRRVTRRHQVMGQWGFDRKLSGGKGVNALFHGHSGTGKTMAAEVIARELKLDLYKIDLAGVVSKYIGETEKNLDRVFHAAHHANAILLFDEADAILGKRSEVRDAHDRYANLEVSYLLQKMEEHEGISILSTNLRQNLDDAFLRRLAFTVAFPFPDEPSRQRIWAAIWPSETPLAPDVDAGWLARRFMLSGGNIRNAALAAAYLAAEDGSAVTLAHVLRAVRSEFLKLGKTLAEAELAPPVRAASGVAT